MTRRRFIADEVSGDRASLVGEHADHLVRVLRARVGQDFDIAAGDAVRRGRITSVENGRVEFELGEEVSGDSLAEITLLLAVFKFDRMEWAIEKCTELGVSRIVPVIARRTDAHLAAASAKRVGTLAAHRPASGRTVAPRCPAGDCRAGEISRRRWPFPDPCVSCWPNRKSELLLRDVVQPSGRAAELFWRLVPKAAGLKTSCNHFRQLDGFPLRSAIRFSAPKLPRSPRRLLSLSILYSL